MFDNMYNRNAAYGATPPTNYAMGMYNRPVAGNQITWVMGVENAKTFPIAPNSTVLLMDSEAPKFYIKTSDMNGMCNLETYKFEKYVEQMTKTPEPNLDNYVTREEFNAAIAKLTPTEPAVPTTSATPARQSLI